MDPRLGLAEAVAHAKRVEALGYDGLHVAETIHDSLGLSLLVAEHTERITIRTAVTLAFPRSPTLTAYAAWDLARLSGGRFQLGLGTQIRQNIEDRYGMPWGEPVERLRDYLGALGALYGAFGAGGPVAHHGPYYRITRLQPYFNPGPDPDTSPPATYLGGVNPAMCQLAGELADGFVTHPTNSNPRYLRSICLPNLAVGAKRSGRDPGDLELVVGTQVITGANDQALAAERERQRRLFAFLYSTPAYRRTLELYGWEEMAPRLAAMVRSGDWGDLASVVTDEVLDTLVPTGRFEEIPGILLDRFAALGQGILLAPPADQRDDAAFARVVATLRAA
ncbi:MAG: TIGR03617 family F420-dependent LLM class oxidoreductase [Acidimicrobiales bacterium]